MTYVAASVVVYGRIPDSQSGVVVDKGPVTDKPGVSYYVSLDTGKTLYIESNQTLYDSLAVNPSCPFTCRIVFLDGVVVIDSAELKPDLALAVAAFFGCWLVWVC